MIRKYVIVAATTLAFQPSYAEQDTKQESTPKATENSENHFGPTFLENKKLDNLNITGPATLEHLTITGETSIMGPAKIKESTLSDLNVSGPLDARKTVVKTVIANGPVKFERVSADDKVTINGPLSAEESNFKATISIATDKMTLDHSTAENIDVRKNSS